MRENAIDLDAPVLGHGEQQVEDLGGSDVFGRIEEQALELDPAGFEVVLLQTGPFREQPGPRHLWVSRVLDRFELDTSLREDGIYAVGRKTGAVRDRYPEWLYS